jgi:uncharacterized protein (AIM24 family)
MRRNHEIDFRIYGEEMQCVEIELDPQETVVAEAGAFMYMDDGIQMETIFGDGSTQNNGFFGKLMSAGKRMLTGESLFMTAFTHHGYSKARVAFASPYPGRIIPMDLQQMGGKVICQKDSFLCAAKGVSVGIEWQKKLGTGLFGGEGFIMQKLEGDGMAFCHAGGHIIERVLAPGEVLRVDTGCIVAYTQDVDFDIQFIGGIKNCSMRFCADLERYGCRRFPSRAWPAESCRMALWVEEKKKVVFSEAWAIYWTVMGYKP